MTLFLMNLECMEIDLMTIYTMQRTGQVRALTH